MFTGIITHLGTFSKRVGNEFIYMIPQELAKHITASSSIAIDGICLTVKKKEDKTIYVYVMAETLKKTILGNLKPNALVNLELPVTAKTFFSGHIVSGHIDGVSKLEAVSKRENNHILKFSLPNDLSIFIAKKGSIAVNGISLTVIEVGVNYFTVGIIPYTWDKTMLHTLRVGDFVNIEADILAKYLERLLKK